MKKNLMLIILLILFTSLNSSIAVSNKYFSENDKKTPVCPLYKNTITIPQGYILGVEPQKEIDLNNLSMGDKYKVTLKSDFIYNGEIIANSGSNILGTISKINFNEEAKQKQILIKFTNIITPDNQNIPISGLFYTENKDGYTDISENGQLQLSEDTGIIIMQPVTYIPLK